MNGRVLICGGAGFIGTNVAAKYLSAGQRVLVLDDLSRAGVERNLEWLRRRFGPLLEFELGDVRDSRTIRRCVREASSVYHFAAQTAVTTSLVTPRADFEVNALGTLTLLEELRLAGKRIPLVFTSTNKVYGKLEKLAVRKNGVRYEPQHPGVLAHGVGEDWPLDFQSPYGCSKGSADQYVLDYARSFGLPNVVFRMSCIYGPHQCGTEDQGWVAHFVIQTLMDRPITVYGDGCQVRDALYVEDLVNAMLLASRNAQNLAGQAFNIGGGVHHTTSLLELIDLITELECVRPEVQFEDWRIGDQRYYVSDTRSFQRATGWQPRVSVREGVRRLHSWLKSTYRAPVAEEALHRGVA
jgi:CDP-paratose 2-epimerase